MLYLQLDKSKCRSYAQQIYKQIREKITDGSFNPGEQLPSSRDLANQLGIARNTVLTAYDLLVSEGLIYSVSGSGFYISPDIRFFHSLVQIQDTQTASLSDVQLSESITNFDSGLPDLSLFPRNKWKQAVSKAFIEAPVSALGYDDPPGRNEFRQVLSGYLKRTRGITCNPNQILITSGTKQGISLVAKSLLDHTSEVWIENPTNKNVIDIFSYHTSNIVPFEVDHEGILPEQFPADRQPSLIFVTPSHQFPMGGVLSLKRRLELTEYAVKTNSYILEDDYDSEFQYNGLPVHSLFELAPENVIYTGTFSKTMFPSMRLGYLVVPSSLIDKISKWKRLADHHSNPIYQLALMRFMENGELERHIRHMKRVYKKRRADLVALLQSCFSDQIKIYGENAGMHFVVEFKDVNFTPELVRQLFKEGIYIVPVENHSLTKGIHKKQIILGFAGLSYAQMEKGIQTFYTVLLSQ